MRTRYFLLLLLILRSHTFFAQSFKSEQMKAPRVKAAYTEKWELLKSELTNKNFDPGNFDLMIRVMKHDKKVEAWLRPKKEKAFRLFKTYDICYYSGGLGPKRKQGDGQVPEGFYNISVFNPYSNYHLSLGVSYPNSSDRIISKSDFGGDIMIHGNCLSIGCIPITDTYIKELYILAVEARNSGQSNVPIWIFPSKLDEKGMEYLSLVYSGNTSLISFWENLKTGYDMFEKNKQLPQVNIDKKGHYNFIES